MVAACLNAFSSTTILSTFSVWQHVGSMCTLGLECCHGMPGICINPTAKGTCTYGATLQAWHSLRICTLLPSWPALG